MSAPLILASASASRRAMLEAAGVPFAVEPARIDEAALKGALLAEGAKPREVADALAEIKAVSVSRRFPHALTLGADQVLAADGRLFDKPADLAAAKAQLRALSGRRHELVSAAVLARGGEAIWRCAETARLDMRPLSEAFLQCYVEAAGEDILSCVGAYRLEGLGAQLFERIEGDYFTVLGLPLFAVLDSLRRQGAIES